MELQALVHGHHATLISWGRWIMERAGEVREIKPKHEVEERIRHMWVPKPEQIDELPQDCVEAGSSYYKALRAYFDAKRTFGKIELYSFFVHPKRYFRASMLLGKAERDVREAWEAYSETCVTRRSELEAWHAKHCKVENCRWNGERLEGIGE